MNEIISKRLHWTSQRFIQLLLQFENLYAIAIPILAVIGGLAVAAILIVASDVNPVEAYTALIRGAFGSAYATATSLDRAIPLVLAGMGVAFAFRCGVWNVGAEGQIYLGGLFGILVGVYITGLPPFIHIPLTLLAGMVGGALWGGIAGYLRAKHGVNEIVSTLMLNYIAIYIIGALVRGPLAESKSSENWTAQIAHSARLPLIFPGTRLHAGIIVAVLAAVLLYILLWRTPIGYEVRTVGANLIAARHAGMNVVWIQILAMLISGGLAGLAGIAEIAGAQYRLRSGFLLNYGYDSIAVAMLGQLDPLGVLISGIFFGALRAGAGTMQRTVNLPSSLVFVVQGTVVFMVASTTILKNLPKHLSRKESGSVS
jgi:ABC-type uncharacterized transport system permease subunit